MDYLVEKSFEEEYVVMMWLFMEKMISNNGMVENLARVATGTLSRISYLKKRRSKNKCVRVLCTSILQRNWHNLVIILLTRTGLQHPPLEMTHLWPILTDISFLNHFPYCVCIYHCPFRLPMDPNIHGATPVWLNTHHTSFTHITHSVQSTYGKAMC